MGPLSGIKIVELAGIGPGPMAAMLLADLGATVIRVDRKVAADLGIKRPLKYNLTLRNRPIIALDLKDPKAVEAVLQMVEGADALIEGFRPGVTERLGLGPDACLKRNPKLVYGRMTGWGQSGPLAMSAGHDLNYIALTGVLNAIGRKDQPPTVPLNIIGDYAGGALYLVLGVLAGIIEAKKSGQGQVVDAAIVDGTASLATTFFGMVAAGIMNNERGTNPADSGSHFYDSYQCKDGKWVSVAPIEGKFHDELLKLLEIDPAVIGKQNDKANWPKAKALLAEKFKTRTRDEWNALLEGTDACYAPVLTWDEAPDHFHLKERGIFIDIDGVRQPAPAPRFSRTVPDTPKPPQETNAANTAAALADWFKAEDIEALRASGVID